MKNGLDEQYIDLLKDILENGVEKNTRNGKVLSVFGRSIRYKFKDGKFPLLTTKKMAWKQIVTELLWFLRGDTNIKFLIDYNCHIWDGDAYKSYTNKFVGYEDIPSIEWFINEIKTNEDFANKFGNLGPVYGAQWRHWDSKGYIFPLGVPGPSIYDGGFDQILNLIQELKTNPDSRRLIVTAWNPSDLDEQVLPPCHYGFQCYTRLLTTKERLDWTFQHHQNIVDQKGWGELYENEESAIKWFESYDIGKIVPKRAISLIWNQRSVDVGLGLPFNIASYGLLLTIISDYLNMVPEELIGNLGDTHLYSNHVELIKEQLERAPFDLPKVSIYTEFWPTESGECGIGPLSSDFSHVIESMQIEDFQLENYKSHPSIKLPLSN